MTRIFDFHNPPVVETVLSVGFAPIGRFTTAHVGLFWESVRTEFEAAAERPRYEMPLERFGGPPRPNRLELKLGSPPANSRMWLISSDDQRLLQVQLDWFAYNWRKRGEPYVHYDEGRRNFEEHFAAFSKFVVAHGLGEIQPTQCEVTYINHISAADLGLGSLHRLLDFVAVPNLVEPAVSVEHAQIAYALALSDAEGQFGRLHVSVQPSSDDGVETWVMNLTARGLPRGDGLEGILSFFDKGREAIVKNFKQMTTNTMHDKWGLK